MLRRGVSEFNSRMGEKGRFSMDKKYGVKSSAIANQIRPL